MISSTALEEFCSRFTDWFDPSVCHLYPVVTDSSVCLHLANPERTEIVATCTVVYPDPRTAQVVWVWSSLPDQSLGSFLLALQLWLAVHKMRVTRIEAENCTDEPPRAMTGIYQLFSSGEDGAIYCNVVVPWFDYDLWDMFQWIYRRVQPPNPPWRPWTLRMLRRILLES